MSRPEADDPIPISPELLALQQAVAGRYSIVRELGRGGMGVVFLAREVALERPVAIKLLPPALAGDPSQRAKFIREAKTAAGLAHPIIVPIHSVEEHHDVVFFVMGFVDGETLADRVAHAGPLGPNDVLRVMQEVSWALAHAHAHGIVHRDVKPHNILLERGTERAIVTDFGIARADDVATTTGQGIIVGTPRYMSPEQASGEALDGRSDVYSLGAVAYFAATGHPPLDGPSTLAILSKIATETPVPVAEVRRSLPPRLAAAIDRCLAKAPADRWPSAEALGVALRSAGGTAVDAPPAVRNFLDESRSAMAEVGTELTVAGTSLAVLAFVMATNAGSDLGSGLTRAFSLVLYVGTAASMAGLSGWRLTQLAADARRLLRAGYGHSAIRSALAARSGNDPSDPPAQTSGGASMLAAGAGVAATAASVWLMTSASGLAGLIGLAGSIVAPAVTVRRVVRPRRARDSWWLRLMAGRFGRALFRVSGIGAPHVRALPVPGEPTSVALGTAVGDLFDALPADQRARFRELPALVDHLVRAETELHRAAPSPARDARLSTVVAAIEALRLDLMRLHAAAASPDDLTRDLDAAARVGDLINARLDVERETDA